MKKLRLPIIIILILVLLCGCASSSKPSAMPAGSGSAQSENSTSYAPPTDEYEYSKDEPSEISLESAASANRKIIYSASMSIYTEDFTGTLQRLNVAVAESGSYMQESSQYGMARDGNARMHVTLRVPQGEYSSVKDFLHTLGEVESASEKGEDVTGSYFDTEARITVLRAQHARVLELLYAAKTLEEIMTVERELANIQTEIERLTTVIKRYDDLTTYATITVDIYQVQDEATIAAMKETNNPTFGKRISENISNSLSMFLMVLEGLLVALLWLLPYIIIAGITLTIILVSKAKKKKRKAANGSAQSPSGQA